MWYRVLGATRGDGEGSDETLHYTMLLENMVRSRTCSGQPFGATFRGVLLV